MNFGAEVAGIQTDPGAKRKAGNRQPCRRRFTLDIVYRRSQVLAFPPAIVKLASTLAHATEIEPNGFDSSFADISGRPRHNFVLHCPAVLRMRMTNDCSTRVALRISAGAPEGLQSSRGPWNEQF